MTQDQIQLIKKTWKVFRGIKPETLGDLFYSKLFTGNPGLRRMFPRIMQGQHQKLIDMLNAIVMRLDKPDDLSADIAAMARRHVGYGVKAVHYKQVGEALLWTLQKGLGEEWTTEVKNAWKSCYHNLSEIMMNAGVADRSLA